MEVTIGTGLIALGIAKFVRQVEATGFSPKMIETAKKKIAPSNVKFSIEDAMQENGCRVYTETHLEADILGKDIIKKRINEKLYELLRII